MVDHVMGLSIKLLKTSGLFHYLAYHRKIDFSKVEHGTIMRVEIRFEPII